MFMKKSIIGLVLALALGCEVRPLPFSRVNFVTQTQQSVAACEYNFYHNPVRNYEYCTSYDSFGDCDCYVGIDPSIVDHECYVEYCYYWDTCQWETYDYVCY
jgi:hypothetical protein